MKRENGYLVLDDILGIKDVVSLEDLKQKLENNPLVNIIDYNIKAQKIVFTFRYGNKTYFYKYDNYVDPIKELIVEEIYKCLNITCVGYDLAKVGIFRGNLSLDFKLDNANYISGHELLQECYGTKQEILYNNLEGIWNALEKRYHNHPNKNQIIKDLMEKIVKCFLVDIITVQTDRNTNNFGIVEYSDGSVDIEPAFDNNRSIFSHFETLSLMMTVDFLDNPNYNAVIDHFLKVSSNEFTNMFKSYIEVISEENLQKIFKRIEAKIGFEILDSQKESYYIIFKKIRDFLDNKIYNGMKKR